MSDTTKKKRPGPYFARQRFPNPTPMNEFPQKEKVSFKFPFAGFFFSSALELFKKIERKSEGKQYMETMIYFIT